MPPTNQLVIFLGLILGGVLLEDIIFKLHHHSAKTPHKIYHYSWAKYLFLLLFPILASIYAITNINPQLVTVFAVFAIFGTFLEWFMGFSFQTITGHRLWSYHRYHLNHHTSFLMIPCWGTAGILFYLLAQILV